MHKYYIVYKPFNVLSQFTSQGDKRCLQDFFHVPSNVYPVGRLDYDSEGLLILTNDVYLNKNLLNPSYAHEREYWVRVEGSVTGFAINILQQGVDININGNLYHTKKCKAWIMDKEPVVAPRTPAIRFRKNIPDTWLKIILTEGKNRQVRKMTAAVGFPTLRLIRYRIEKIAIDKMLPGDMKELSRTEMYNLLQIKR